MSKTYTNLIYHVVFSTRDRQPIITADRRERLYEYIGGTLRGIGGISLAINGVEDHVHVLAKLRPDRALSDVLRDLKSNSSGWLNDVFPDTENFHWQRGYGAFTVSVSQVPRVVKYIADQEKHHASKSFEHEFIGLLRKNEIEFDPRYLWT